MLRATATLVALMVAGGCARERTAAPESDIKKVLPFGSFSPPNANQTLSGSVVVGGWAIHESGIESVRLYLDREYLLDANIGLDRPDVATVYPTFKRDMISGWNALLETAHVPAGAHELIAKVRARDGSQRDFTVPVVIAKSP